METTEKLIIASGVEMLDDELLTELWRRGFRGNVHRRSDGARARSLDEFGEPITAQRVADLVADAVNAPSPHDEAVAMAALVDMVLR